MKSRIFYFAPVATDALNTRHKQHLHIGPADNKVFSVGRALRAAGCRVVVVSAVLNHLAGTSLNEALRAEGQAFVRLYSRGGGAVKRLISAISYFLFCLTIVRRQDRVIFYNFFPEFIPAAWLLKLRGAPGILDVEDGPRADEPGARGIMVRTSYKMMATLVSPRHLTVSNRLAKQLGLSPALAVYGVAKKRNSAREIFKDEEVNILYGGAILPDTGLYLFSDAIRRLTKLEVSRRIHIHITGTYDFKILSALESEVNSAGSRVHMTCHQGLSLTAYKSMLESIDVGLCLKLSSSEMGQTTFPSKVVEYSSLGILVLSTAVSDVPDLFDENSAVILRDETPEHLAQALAQIVLDTAKSKAIASRGCEVAERCFSAASVGMNVRDFVFG